MDQEYTKIVCLKITPDNRILPVVLSFPVNKEMAFRDIFQTMKDKYECHHYMPLIAKAFYPDDSYYHAFYESNNFFEKRFNKIATHFINRTYNNDKPLEKFKRKCYGVCYIVKYDDNYELHDIHRTEFFRSYNRIEMFNCLAERQYNNKIYHARQNYRCYVYKKKDCTIV